ncbi:MAG TPA: phage protease [Accumulibacter sp.]|nr:phage protease [Accumulibacter sp.]
MPPGVFRAIDGRPVGSSGWMIDAAIAAGIIADLATRDDLVIDYEHQTQLAKQNGQPAPAAGWFNRVVWREGQGLFAVDVKWTEKAKRMIGDGEYRYISPVFTFSAETGRVERLLALGLTNTPGLNGLTDLSNVAVNTQQVGLSPSAELIARAAVEYQEQQAACGVHVTTVLAVEHVERRAGRSTTASLAAAGPSFNLTSTANRIARAAVQYQEQQAALGILVSTAQAVMHVEPSHRQYVTEMSNR